MYSLIDLCLDDRFTEEECYSVFLSNIDFFLNEEHIIKNLFCLLMYNVLEDLK